MIRTKEDVGMILLLDERFLQEEYLNLFPREWNRFDVCSIRDVEAKTGDFWGRHQN